MLRATLKSLLARKLRLILSGLAVLLGVMFVSGSFVLTDAIGRSFDNMFANALADSDVIVTPPSNDEMPHLLSEADVARIDGLKSVVGMATGTIQVDGARVIGSNGKVVTTYGPPRFGGNWTDTGGIELREGAAPKSDRQIAINAALARKAGLKLHDQVGVLTTQPKETFELVGIFGYEGGLDSRGPVDEVRFTTPAAQRLMLGQAGFTSITVDAKDGVTPEAARDALRAELGAGYSVRTGKEVAAAAANSFKQVLDVMNKILLGFAGVALFVGIFLILNTFSIIVAQRTKELALARALGAGRGQMIGSVLVEAVVIGLIASVLGLAAGIGVGAAMAAWFASFTTLQLAGITVPIAAVIAAFTVGIVITVIAALLPAVRASRVPPVAALQEVATPDRPLTKLTLAGAIVTAGGGAAIAYGLSNSVWYLMVGVLGCFIGVALLSPFIARPVVSLLGRIFSWSVAGKLGRVNSGRNPRRTAITAAALMVGIALVTGFNTIMTSADRSFRGEVAQNFHGDLVISGQESPGVTPTFDAQLLPRMQTVTGVQTVVATYADEVLVGGKPAYAEVQTDMPAAMRRLSVKMVAGSNTPGPRDVVVDEEQGHAIGDTLTVRSAKGTEETYTVTGIYKDQELFNGYQFGADAVAGMRSQQPAYALVDLNDGADVATARKGLEALLVDSPEMLVQTQQEYIDSLTGEIAQFLLMIQVLLGLAILIAILGVVNTLALSVLERTRELGLLRAIGLSRMATMRMVTVEAVVITVFGALLGLGVGVGLGSAVVKGLSDEGLKDIVLPWQQMGVYLVVGAIVGVLAAVLPAIKAARTNVLSAIAYE